MRKENKKDAFTLVELLVVLMVIGVLGGIIFSGATHLFGEQAIKQTNAEIGILQLSLEEYNRDFGTFPVTDGITDAEQCGKILLNALIGSHDENGIKLSADENRKSYLPKDKFEIEFPEGEEDGFIVDPWEQPYQYNYPRLDGHEGFLLFSKGPDKKSQLIDEPVEETPEKSTVDFDNIPSSEPGKW
jgi:prepilin-type N-terminal cleavage/methylation domain-containing protein